MVCRAATSAFLLVVCLCCDAVVHQSGTGDHELNSYITLLHKMMSRSGQASGSTPEVKMVPEESGGADDISRGFRLPLHDVTKYRYMGLGKRRIDYRNFNVGLGKRRMDRMNFNVGLGKRRLDNRNFNVGLGRKRSVADVSTDGKLEKRLDRVNFSIGLGKRKMDGVNYNVGLGKRKMDGVNYKVGLGKRKMDGVNFSVGLGKRKMDDVNFSVGLRKRKMDGVNYNVGLGKRKMDGVNYNVGLGKRKMDGVNYNVGLGKRKMDGVNFNVGLGKRKMDGMNYNVGLGKRGTDRRSFLSELEKKKENGMGFDQQLGRRMNNMHVSEDKKVESDSGSSSVTESVIIATPLSDTEAPEIDAVFDPSNPASPRALQNSPGDQASTRKARLISVSRRLRKRWSRSLRRPRVRSSRWRGSVVYIDPKMYWFGLGK